MAGERSLKLEALRALLGQAGAREVLERGPAAAVKLQEGGGDKAAAMMLSAEERQAAEQFLSLLEAAVLLAAANGEISEPEVEQLHTIFSELAAGVVPGEHFEIWLERFLTGMNREGFEARAEKNAVAIRSPELRRSAFVMAVGVACIDGVFDEAERKACDALATHYQLPAEEARALREKIEAELRRP
jgi:tellurite resistance protein